MEPAGRPNEYDLDFNEIGDFTGVAGRSNRSRPAAHYNPHFVLLADRWTSRQGDRIKTGLGNKNSTTDTFCSRR